MTAAFVLLNPEAGGGLAGRHAEPMRQWLAANAPGVSLVESDSIGRSRAMLQCLPEGTRVILAGGDGTLHHMLPVLLAQGFPLGLVPLGVGNDTARALGLHGLPWERALSIALDGPISSIDTGELVTARRRVPFASCLAFGFDAAVNLRKQAAPAWLAGGASRLLWAALGEVAHLRHWPMRVTVDGEVRHQGRALLASTLNTATCAGGLRAMPPADVADGRLNLLVMGRLNRAQALLMLPRLRAGNHLGHPRVGAIPFKRLHIETREDSPLCADGEPLGTEHDFDVRVRRDALRVVRSPG